MQDGYCPKCGEADIRFRITPSALISGQSPTQTLRTYVCLTCGYTETYVRAGDLHTLAAADEWRPVVSKSDNLTPVPVTGETIRLAAARAQTARANALALHDPPPRCPACQANTFIPAVRIRDTGQYARGDLTVEVDRFPDALVRKGTVHGILRARICAVCGHTSLFVDNPRAFYKAYVTSK